MANLKRPDGNNVKTEEEKFEAWHALMDPIAMALGMEVVCFDPSIVLEKRKRYEENSKKVYKTLDRIEMSSDFAFKLAALIHNGEYAQEMVKCLSDWVLDTAMEMADNQTKAKMKKSKAWKKFYEVYAKKSKSKPPKLVDELAARRTLKRRQKS